MRSNNSLTVLRQFQTKFSKPYPHSLRSLSSSTILYIPSTTSTPPKSSTEESNHPQKPRRLPRQTLRSLINLHHSSSTFLPPSNLNSTTFKNIFGNNESIFMSYDSFKTRILSSSPIPIHSSSTPFYDPSSLNSFSSPSSSTSNNPSHSQNSKDSSGDSILKSPKGGIFGGSSTIPGGITIVESSPVREGVGAVRKRSEDDSDRSVDILFNSPYVEHSMVEGDVDDVNEIEGGKGKTRGRGKGKKCERRDMRDKFTKREWEARQAILGIYHSGFTPLPALEGLEEYLEAKGQNVEDAAREWERRHEDGV
ncbi:hypothetical protein TREMEDRAFT_61911 [Tremella mesenterica DSM 1558]|uniref:uncharacterized protein n=1 Tax=Tremella mesenterica (strain ATCC 24925 / CBS 8224 / DSM 1558 / NBRC 9311 / NRRL Y-6157 / RJB 2259-6 / UBC 559-6) TaxID=578456 RepID=UPI0003F498C9|nr:uncharacterized protein TREMEDRAFT_61911 [Tremella mesenterica DSM 1558]EIW70150.1 hypothetical protein TREMEDRAFT_61911 [Tremella mesenterica DSM 1558]